MIISVVYLLVRCLLGCLRVLTGRQVSKDSELLVLRHEIAVLRRKVSRPKPGRADQLGGKKVRFTPPDRALLAALLHRLPRDVLKRLHLVVRPDTVLRWHRDVVARRHARRDG